MKLSLSDKKVIIKSLERLGDAEELVDKFKQSLKESNKSSKNPKSKSNTSTGCDWSGECDICGCGPTVPVTGMCGPCTFGEAETVGGNW
jgi:hypothetical protein